MTTKARADAAQRYSDGVTALSKRHDTLGETVAALRKQLNQITADVEVLERTAPIFVSRRPQ